jgi:hypothetical protein
MDSPVIVHVPLVCPGAPRKVKKETTPINFGFTNKDVCRKLF